MTWTSPGTTGCFQAIREKEISKPSTRLSQVGEREKEIAHRRRIDTRSLSRELRGDLDWIALKALEKDRERRYASVSELESDVERYLAGEPVLARRPSVLYRARKFTRRHRALTVAAVVVLVLITAGVTTVFLVQERARTHIERVAEDLRRESYVSRVSVTFQRLNESNLGAARELLEAQRPAPGQEDLRGFEWRYLWERARSDEMKTFSDGTAHGIAFSPDGRLLAYGAGKRILVRERRHMEGRLRPGG